MNSKIKNYIDVVFKDVPRSKKAIELKEEIASNLNERFEDYMREGKSETESYGLAIANMGDVDEMIKEVMPNEDFVLEARTYRNRNAKYTALGVCLYICGVAALILFAIIGEQVGNEDLGGAVGVITLLILAAIATGMIVYTHMSTPKEYKDYEDNQEEELKSMKPRDRKIFESISSIYWLSITAVYLLISFITHHWEITWIIWVIAGIAHQIIIVLFQLRGIKE